METQLIINKILEQTNSTINYIDHIKLLIINEESPTELRNLKESYNYQVKLYLDYLNRICALIKDNSTKSLLKSKINSLNSTLIQNNESLEVNTLNHKASILNSFLKSLKSSRLTA